MKTIYIIVLIVVILFLLLIDLLVISKRNKENFQNNSDEFNSAFKNSSEFIDYSKNSDKLLDMFKSLDDIENKCQIMDEQERIREEKQQMRINDDTFKELEEQDKKIDELKEIIKYLNIEKKRKDTVNNTCQKDKQIKLNEQYNIVKDLSKTNLLQDTALNVDLNVSDSLKKLSLSNNNNNNNNNNKNKNKNSLQKSGSEYVNIDKINLDKCYGCDSNKLKKNAKFLVKDFQ
jgi:hypothetical protein